MRSPSDTDLLLMAAAPADGGGAPSGPGGRPPSPFKGLGLAYIMVSSVLLGLGGGWLLDRHLGTSPRWTLILGLLFIAAGFVLVVQEARK
jgi:hypothetical protein